MAIFDRILKFIKRDKKSEKIAMEQIIAGAFLKFKELDNLDIRLLVEKFEKMDNVLIDGYFRLDSIRQYLNISPDGKITLKPDVTLDNLVHSDDITIREHFIDVAGIVVYRYFKNFSRALYLEEKEKYLSEEKTKLLNGANVLLISDNEKDYKGLVKHGFQNIDYFKSIVRADNYFKENPEELKKYHIILQGSKCINYLTGSNIEIEETIDYLDDSTRLIAHVRRQADSKKIAIRLRDNHLWRDWEIRDHKYSHIIDAILENGILNKVMEKHQSTLLYMPINDFVNEKKIPFPKNKRDLKILLLDSAYVSAGLSDELKKELGLDITFREDDNDGLGCHVIRNLGKYDIIIASHIYSSDIVHMNLESSEQCKDSGRRLTLLLANEYDGIGLYDEDGRYDRDGIGNSLRLDYSFGGELAPNNMVCSQEFNVLIGKRGDSLESWSEEKKKMIMATICGAIDIYNSALTNLEEKQVAGLKSIADYNLEYDNAVRKYEEEKAKELEPIKTVNNMIYDVRSYLYYKRLGLCSGNLEGLKITERNDGVCVESVLDGRTICAITFKDDGTRENISVFSICSLNKKGILGTPELVGVYTKKFEGLKNTPKRPDEVQMKLINGMAKKINLVLEPINIEANARCTKKRVDAQRLSRKKQTKKGNKRKS